MLKTRRKEEDQEGHVCVESLFANQNNAFSYMGNKRERERERERERGKQIKVNLNPKNGCR